MTILSTNSRMSYTGNSATSNYSFTFKIFNEDDLLLTVRHPTTGVETELTLTTDYTVTIGSSGTGSIDLVDDSQAWLTGGFLTSAWILVIRRVVELKQETDIRNQGAFFPENHEDAFDYAMMAIQQLKDEVDRSLKVAETDSALTLRLPTSTERASTFLAFNSTGQPIASSGTVSVPVSTYMETLLDDTDAATARATLGFTGTLATAGNVGTSALVDDSVTNAKLDNMAALSVKANATNASANPTDLAAASDYMVLQRIGTALVFTSYKKSYRNATTTDAIATTDDTIVFSGASFTATLPTAVGVSGKRYTLQHGGTSLTQVYTLATTSAQTIGGIASGSYVLYTNGEALEVESNGANWLIVNHYAQTDWVDAGAMTITAESSNPTKGTTVDLDKIFWRRNGKDVDLIYQYHQAASAGSAGGTGNYIWGFPSNITADTAIIPATGAALDADLISTGQLTCMIGQGYVTGSANKGPALCVLRTSTSFSVGAMQGVTSAAAPIASGTNYALTVTNISYNYRISGLPVSGWRP